MTCIRVSLSTRSCIMSTDAAIITELLCAITASGWLGSRVVSALKRRRASVQIAAATLSGNSLRQTVHTRRASVHQATKLVAALLRVARVTAGLAKSNGSLPPAPGL